MEAQSTPLLNDELKLMLGEKGKTCISIIVPLHRSFPGVPLGHVSLVKAIEAVSTDLIANYPGKANVLIEAVNDLYNQIDFNRKADGFGFYVSVNYRYFTFFPFTVSEKIVIADRFEMRDLMYSLQYFLSYFVLHFNNTKAHLYSGKQKQLEELKNKAFPVEYNDEYEQERASSLLTTINAGIAAKVVERDNHEIGRVMFDTLLPEVDELLSPYISAADALIVCGSRPFTSAFLNRTHHVEKIISIINGNPDWFNIGDISDTAWQAVEAFVHKKMLDEIGKFEDMRGEGLAEEGIADVWEAASEGRGLTLLVERDFEEQGYLDKQDSSRLHLQKPKRNCIVLNNSVNDLVQMVLVKDGKVLFVENGMLERYNHIALMTGY